VHRLTDDLLSKVTTKLSEYRIEQATYRAVAYPSYVARREGAQPGGDQMVSQFNIVRVDAGEFTRQESSTGLEVAKARIELLGAVRPGKHLALTQWTGDKPSIRVAPAEENLR